MNEQKNHVIDLDLLIGDSKTLTEMLTKNTESIHNIIGGFSDKDINPLSCADVGEAFKIPHSKITFTTTRSKSEEPLIMEWLSQKGIIIFDKLLFKEDLEKSSDVGSVKNDFSLTFTQKTIDREKETVVTFSYQETETLSGSSVSNCSVFW